MKEHPAVKSPFIKLFNKSRKVVRKEVHILFTLRICLPAKYFLKFSLSIRHYLRCCICSPLGKKVGYLKVFYATFKTYINKSLYLIKVKAIGRAVFMNLNQLNRSPLSTYLGIKWRCKSRYKYGINS